MAWSHKGLIGNLNDLAVDTLYSPSSSKTQVRWLGPLLGPHFHPLLQPASFLLWRRDWDQQYINTRLRMMIFNRWEEGGDKPTHTESQSNSLSQDNMWGLVMKAVPKLDESESGQMVLK